MIQKLIDDLCKAGLLDDFTDCQEMTDNCKTCSQYEDCKDAMKERV